MSTAEAMKQELVQQGKTKDFPSMLKLYESEVSKALPEHLRANIGRYTRLALTQFRQNSKLMECDPRSVFAGVILASQLGLELGVMGHGYLVPYKNHRTGIYTAQFIPGWKGYVDLVHRSGRAIVWTGCVFKGDKFEYQLGDNPFVRHVPMGNDNEEEITHAYAVGHVKGIEWPIVEVWPVDKIKRHLIRVNKVGDSHYAYENKEMYARKVVLLQVVKYLPASVELSTMVSLDNSFAAGRPQDITIDAAAEGIYFQMGETTEPLKDNEEAKKTAETESTGPDKASAETAAKAATASAEAEKADKKKQAQEKKQQEETKKREEAEKKRLAEEQEEFKRQAALKEEEAKKKAAAEQERSIEDEEAAAIAAEGSDSAEDDDGPGLPEQEDEVEETGKEIRGVRFPAVVVATTVEEKPTADQLEELKMEAKILKVSPEKTAKLWLNTELGDLSSKAVDCIIKAMKTYQK